VNNGEGLFLFLCFGFFVLRISKNKKCGGPTFCCQGLEESGGIENGLEQ